MATKAQTLFDSYRNNNVTNTKLLVRDGPTDLFGYRVINTNAAIGYLQMFNSATTGAVTLGTTVPDAVIPVPATGASVVEAGQLPIDGFPLGLVIAATTTPGGSTALVSGVDVVLKVK